MTASNVGDNPEMGPYERKLAEVIASAQPGEIDKAAAAWLSGVTTLEQASGQIVAQQTKLQDKRTFGEPGLRAGEAYAVVNTQVAARRAEMQEIADALTAASVALTAAQSTQLPAVLPGADPEVVRNAEADNVAIRELAKNDQRASSLDARERESKKALKSLQTALDQAAEKMRPVVGESRDTDPIPTPVATGPGTPGRTRTPAPGVIGTPTLVTPTTPTTPTTPVTPTIPTENPPPVTHFPPTNPAPDNDTAGPLAPFAPSAPSTVPAATTPGTTPGVPGTSAATGVTAALASTTAAVALTRGSSPLTGLAPGTSTAQLGRSATSVPRGTLGRAGMTPGQSATGARGTSAGARGAASGGRTGMAPGQSGTRGVAGRRGPAAAAGTGGRSGRRERDEAEREALAYDDRDAWLDDDDASGAVLS